MVPRELGQAASEGSVDAGLMAVADFIGLEGTFELTSPPMGIAVRDDVRSVVLLSQRRRVRSLDGRRIGVTRESSTSRRLLQLLARARWRIEPQWVPEDDIQGDPRESVDAMLLIGDRALETVADTKHGWERVIDLASEWREWQKLPFVFAVWAVRTTLPRRERERFAGFLTGSLAVGSEHLLEIATAAAGDLGTKDDLAAYLGNFVYRLGAAEREGLRRFRDLLADHDILEYRQTPV